MTRLPGSGTGPSPTRSPLALVDSHCHIQADAFSADAFGVLAEAVEAGLRRVLVPGWDGPSSRAAVTLAERVATGLADTDGRVRVDASAGIHPHLASGADDGAWAEIVALAESAAVVAIGETGLDYDRALSPHVAQLVNLRRHLRLGRALGRPVILHCRSKPDMRDAQDELLRELALAGAGTPVWPTPGGRPPALLHSFSGPLDYAERAIEMGLAISFSGLVFRAGEEASAAAARLVPADRLLVETDSPYLSPPGAPRRRNEPRWVEVTLRWLAAQRGDDEIALGEQLVRNYDRIFGR